MATKTVRRKYEKMIEDAHSMIGQIRYIKGTDFTKVEIKDVVVEHFDVGAPKIDYIIQPEGQTKTFKTNGKFWK